MKRIVLNGHDFRPEYRNLKHIIKQLGDVPIIGLTCNCYNLVQEDILKNLDMSDATTFKASFNRPNLYYEVRTKKTKIESDIIYQTNTKENQELFIA
jgi:ATP-dependent DNA helicase RecQ